MMQEDTPNATRPFNEALELKKRTEFSHREVGLTHPDNNAFMRITDSGSIEVFAAPGIGIIINPNTRSISFYADSIKFYSKEDDGLRWNEKSFNPAADVYNEPAFLKTSDFSNNPAYNRVGYYLNNIQEIEQNQQNSPVTIMGRYSLRSENSQEMSDIKNTAFSKEQSDLINRFAESNTTEETEALKQFMSSGYSYEEALVKIKEKDLINSESSENFSWTKKDLDK